MTEEIKELPDFRVLNEIQAAKVLGISARSLQQYRLEGRGPAYVQLTTRRIGYTMIALQTFVEERTRQSTSDRGQAA